MHSMFLSCSLFFFSGTDIITQGELGSHFFLLASGEADVYVSKRGGEPMKVLTYTNGSGAAFGELALMYNAPRAATVRASTDVKVWALDQTVFRSIVVGSAAKRMDAQINFLKEVKVLNNLTEKERREVADALTRRSFNTGQVIVRQGDRGNDFYIIEGTKLPCFACWFGGFSFLPFAVFFLVLFLINAALYFFPLSYRGRIVVYSTEITRRSTARIDKIGHWRLFW